MRKNLLNILLIVILISTPVFNRLLTKNDDEAEVDPQNSDDQYKTALSKTPVETKSENDPLDQTKPINVNQDKIEKPVEEKPLDPKVNEENKEKSNHRSGLIILVAVGILGLVAIGTALIMARPK